MVCKYKVIFGLRWGEVSGVDVFSAQLAHALVQAGIPSKILLTHSPSSFHLPLAADLPVHQLDTKKEDSWRVRWRKMIDYLESEAPCIYIPNYDYQYSCVSPRLSNRVIVLGIIHSDDPVHYEHVGRLGSFWNGIVAVSKAIADKAVAADSGIAARMNVIPYGVAVPDELPQRSREKSHGLRLIYVGRLNQHQKRILELPVIFQKLFERHIPFEATIVGDGPERQLLLESCKDLIARKIVHWKGIIPNDEVQKMLENQDAILLTSEFEGLPICILEGMARGCVPVCTQIESGLPELIRHRQNGFVIPQGDHSGFVDCLSELQSNPNLLQQISANAYETVREHYELRKMFRSYVELIERLILEAEAQDYVRPRGRILPPSTIRTNWKDHLPTGLRKAGNKGRKYLRKAFYGSSYREKTPRI